MRACRYVEGWLEQGSTLSGTALRTFVTTVNGLPPGLSRALIPGLNVCSDGPSNGVPGDMADTADLYRFELHYPDRPSVLLTARVSWCGDLGISNGSRTGQLTDDLIRLLDDTVGLTMGLPGPATPAP